MLNMVYMARTAQLWCSGCYLCLGCASRRANSRSAPPKAPTRLQSGQKWKLSHVSHVYYAQDDPLGQVIDHHGSTTVLCLSEVALVCENSTAQTMHDPVSLPQGTISKLGGTLV